MVIAVENGIQDYTRLLNIENTISVIRKAGKERSRFENARPGVAIAIATLQTLRTTQCTCIVLFNARALDSLC